MFHRGGRQLKDFRGARKLACEAAGLGAIRVHDLRRSAACNLIRAGVPENIAMRFTEHEASAIIRRYDIVTRDDLAQASDGLGDYLARQPPTVKVVPLRKAE